MTEKMNVQDNYVISHAKKHVTDMLSNDWIRAVNYLKTKVAQAFPGANRPNARSQRNINKANAGKGSGRGHGGRFGRGGGRG